MTDQPSFCLIWNPSGEQPPRFRHPTVGDAMAEATRLARKYPGQEFIVLEALRSVTSGKLTVTSYAVDEDFRIPF